MCRPVWKYRTGRSIAMELTGRWFKVRRGGLCGIHDVRASTCFLLFQYMALFCCFVCPFSEFFLVVFFLFQCATILSSSISEKKQPLNCTSLLLGRQRMEMAPVFVLDGVDD